ncbi:hypothetical protein BC829DRAFT_443750 [Chytridium lagenaria]|nr:hypothetical protein BC829DRAFT_443750 [Chytridium lagenaria]
MTLTLKSSLSLPSLPDAFSAGADIIKNPAPLLALHQAAGSDSASKTPVIVSAGVNTHVGTSDGSNQTDTDTGPVVLHAVSKLYDRIGSDAPFETDLLQPWWCTHVRAALLNSASSLSAFIGMAISILVSSTPSLSTNQETIVSIAAQSKTGEDEKEVKVKSKFTLKASEIHPFSWTRVLAQHLGLWVGWLVMVLIALYGESIKL